MPIKYWIEKDHRRVRAVVSGDFTIDDVFRAIQSSTEDADFEPGIELRHRFQKVRQQNQ
jgi:hypothetical protein